MQQIQLYGKYSHLFTLVDDEDFDYLMQWSWHYLKPTRRTRPGHQGYAMRNEGRQKIYMHRVIMNAPPGMEVDHRRPGSGLDNRRENLRIVDHATNIRNTDLWRSNTSGYRGVSWVKGKNNWRADITVRGRRNFLGYYETAELAAEAYRSARTDMGLLVPDSER